MRKYLPLLLLAFSVPALAHPGHGADSFQAGFLHPLTGLDHLLMLTGAGVLSALSGRKLLLPFATLGMMLVGAVAVSYTHLTLPTTCNLCRSRWSPYH